jgi:TPR repeat protein
MEIKNHLDSNNNNNEGINDWVNEGEDKNENEDEIGRLKRIFKRNNEDVKKYIKRIYSLLINKIILDKATDDDLYYLGIYYQFICIDSELMKKYYSRAIEKGHTAAMYGLGYYYYKKGDFDLMEKYYLQASDNGYAIAMYKLGKYYYKKGNSMGKYYLQAIDNGGRSAMMYDLGYCYYNKGNLMEEYYSQAIDNGHTANTYNLGHNHHNKVNFNLMEKYYQQAQEYLIMATEKGNRDAITKLILYLNDGKISKNCLYDFALAMIKSNFRLIRLNELISYTNINLLYEILDSLCLTINNKNMSIDNFDYIVSRVLTYRNEDFAFKNLNYFMRYISKLYYSKNKKESKKESKKKGILFKKYLHEELDPYSSQILMEYMLIQYDKYIEIKYAPGGKEFKKLENHFEIMAKNQESNKNKF